MLGIYYDSLPHWVVDFGCYSLLLRPKGTLPAKVMIRLREINQLKPECEPLSDAALDAQRESFKVLEHYLDKGTGNCPFETDSIRAAFSQYLADYRDQTFSFSHWVIMPNHVHLLTNPWRNEDVDSFKRTLTTFKMKSAHWLNAYMQQRGAFWQQNWYDRWVRGSEEHGNWVRYFQENPVKAKLCETSEDWVGLR